MWITHLFRVVASRKEKKRTSMKNDERQREGAGRVTK